MKASNAVGNSYGISPDTKIMEWVIIKPQKITANAQILRGKP